jgi:AraC-like DNA-binding protein
MREISMMQSEAKTDIKYVDNIDKTNITPNIPVLLAEYLQSKGFTNSQILKKTTITTQMLQQEEHLYSYRQVQQLVKNALTLSEKSELGLLIGGQENISNWGLLGYALMSCKTLQAAIEIGIKYQRTAQTTLMTSISREENLQTITAVASYPLNDLLPFWIEEQFSSTISILSSITGRKIVPLEINLSYSPPPHAKKYEDFFQCTINFNRNFCSMKRDIKRDNEPLVYSDPITAKLSEATLRNLLLQNTDSQNIVQNVRFRLLRIPGQFPNMEMVAKELGLNQRTLRRNLQQQGSSFTDINDDVRKNLAIEYLCSSNLSIEKIGYILGFAESSNFRRAFKRWTGNPPSSYRPS